MSKASRNKKVSSPVIVGTNHNELTKIGNIDSSLPEAPPEGIPEEAKRVITLLVRRVLQLEYEWS